MSQAAFFHPTTSPVQFMFVVCADKNIKILLCTVITKTDEVSLFGIMTTVCGKFPKWDIYMTKVQSRPGYNQPRAQVILVTVGVLSLPAGVKLMNDGTLQSRGCCTRLVLMVSHTQMHVKHLVFLTHTASNRGLYPQTQKKAQPVVPSPGTHIHMHPSPHTHLRIPWSEVLYLKAIMPQR